MTEDTKIFKSLKITEEDYILKVEGVFSDEFQKWLTYWMSDELTSALTDFTKQKKRNGKEG